MKFELNNSRLCKNNYLLKNRSCILATLKEIILRTKISTFYLVYDLTIFQIYLNQGYIKF